MAIINKRDFKGNIKISQNPKESSDLQSYINRNQEYLLRCLLGDYQYNVWLNQYDTSDPTAEYNEQKKFDRLLDGLKYYDDENVYHDYTGIKQALRYQTYWDYVRNLNARPTSVGVQFVNAENSANTTNRDVNAVIEQRYNLGVELYNKGCEFLKWTKNAKIWFNKASESNPKEYVFDIDLSPLPQPNQIDDLPQFKNLPDIIDLLEKEEEFTTTQYPNETFIIDNIENPTPTVFEITASCQTTGLDFYNTDPRNAIVINPFKDFICKEKNYSMFDGMFI